MCCVLLAITTTLAVPTTLGKVFIEESRNNPNQEQEMHKKKSKNNPFHCLHP